MFCSNFEKTALKKTAEPGVARQFGKALGEQVTGKLNNAFNVLGAIDQGKTVSQKMKVPLGAPRVNA
jgi:hypothetical protein